MTRFISGENRSQSTLFPEALDDYIHEDNSVRVVEVFRELFADQFTPEGKIRRAIDKETGSENN